MACIDVGGGISNNGNLGAITPGSGSTLQSASRNMHEASVTELFSGTGSHTLTINFAGLAGSDDYNCVLAAFKAASAGTAPTGMYVAHQTYYSEPANADSATDDFPAIGNLIVLDSNTQTYAPVLSSVSDTTNGSYIVDLNGDNAYPIFAHKANASPGNPLIVTVTYTSGHTVDYFRMYDIVGAATTQPDAAVTCPSPSTKTGNVCTNTVTQSGSSNVANSVNITPSAPGIVFDLEDQVNNFPTGVTSPSGTIFECMNQYTGETLNENYCAGTGFSHITVTGTPAPLNFTWSESGSGTGSVESAAISFTQASGVGAAPAPPTNLVITAVH